MALRDFAAPSVRCELPGAWFKHATLSGKTTLSAELRGVPRPDENGDRRAFWRGSLDIVVRVPRKPDDPIVLPEYVSVRLLRRHDWPCLLLEPALAPQSPVPRLIYSEVAFVVERDEKRRVNYLGSIDFKLSHWCFVLRSMYRAEKVAAIGIVAVIDDTHPVLAHFEAPVAKTLRIPELREDKRC